MATTIAVTLPTFGATAESGFTVTRLRDMGVTTALSDSALQMLLDDAFAAIVEEIGPPGEVEERASARGDLWMLGGTAASIVSVTEQMWSGDITLSSDDYELTPSGNVLIRLRTGTNPSWCWRGRIRVLYVPLDDTARRNVAATALVKLAIAHNPGLASQTIGTWAEAYTNNSAFNYELERASILDSLHPDVRIW